MRQRVLASARGAYNYGLLLRESAAVAVVPIAAVVAELAGGLSDDWERKSGDGSFFVPIFSSVSYVDAGVAGEAIEDFWSVAATLCSHLSYGVTLA